VAMNGKTRSTWGGRWVRHMLLVGVTAMACGGCGVSYLCNPQVRFAPDAARKLPEALVNRPGFYLGVATSAYQIEGGNVYCDWYHAEQTGAVKLADKCGAAVDAWNRVPDDIKLIQGLGANAYRFSIEWSRLERVPGQYDDEAFRHYADEVTQLRAAGITPMVTLLHFTLPQWLAERGGILAPEFPERFAAFAHEAAKRLGAQVTLWCTINEPNVQMLAGYLGGGWVPNRNSWDEAVDAFVALVKAHAAAAAVLHREVPGAQVGVAQAVVYMEPRCGLNPVDWLVADGSANAFNWAFYDSIAAGRIRFSAPNFRNVDEPLPGLAGSADFFGMNYYRRVQMRLDLLSSPVIQQEDPASGVHNDLGWSVYPEGLLQLLRESWRRYRLPIHITENGMADSQGTARVAFLDDHLYAVGLALEEGIPVKGYFHWSLMDNFEWADGKKPRFGLFRVDYDDNYRRLETPAVAEFRRLAAQILQGRAP
jgi:beta-glucosidase